MDNKYYLAIETKPNNYFPINLLDVKIFNGTTSDNLETLDRLTLNFTKEEIMTSIKEANLLEIDMDMPLIIIYYEKDKKRKINALTKDYSFDMWDNMSRNYDNKNYVNKIINFLTNNISEEEINKIKSVSNKQDFLLEISKLEYKVQRKLYFYLYA